MKTQWEGFRMGTCPECGNLLTSVRIETVPMQSPGAPWHGIKYVCPFCNCVLSVAIDPFALKNDIVNEILKALHKG